jgi:tetratricopeptide (TPR) repeat protein
MSRSFTMPVVFLLAALAGCARTGLSAPRDARAPAAADFLEVADAADKLGASLRAQQYLTAALEAGAEETKVVPRLLVLYVADGQYRLAIDQSENYLRRHPDDRQVRLLLSTLYTAVGDDESAVAQYERLLALSPRAAYAHFALASLLHERGGASARADAHFRAYLELAPRGEHAAEARGLLLKGVQ